MQLKLCEGSKVVKCVGLKILWLSAFVGSNPTPRIIILFLSHKSLKDIKDFLDNG